MAHPVVALFTIADRVSLVQAGEPQRFVSQLLMGSTTELLLEPRNAVTREPGDKHAAASGLPAIPVSARVHWSDSPCLVTHEADQQL